MSDTWHSWDYSADGVAPVQTFEFGGAQNQLDASNRVAKYLELDALPEGSTLVATNAGAEAAAAPETTPEPPPSEPEPTPAP